MRAELRHGGALLLYFRQLRRDRGRVKVFLAHQLVRMVAQGGHLLLLAGHQVLEGVMRLQMRLHFLDGGATVCVGQGDFLDCKNFDFSWDLLVSFRKRHG